MILADKIIDLRKKNGWSQEELAEKLGVSRQAVSKWESAQAIPDLGRVLAMADLFSVTTDYLLRDENEAPTPAAVEDGRVGKQCSPRQHGRSERLPRPLPEAGAHTRLGGQSVRAFTDSAADDSLPHGRRTCGGRGQHHRRGDSAAAGCGSGCHLPAAGHGKQGIRISGAGGH